MSRSSIPTIIAAVLSLAAAYICSHLLEKHLTGSSGATWFEAGCTDDEEPGGADCAAVLASPYSYFPPKREDSPEDRPHLPVALMGLVYYSALALWLIGVGRPSRRRRGVHLVPLLVVAGGLAGSVYYTFIMLTVLDEWCTWCLVTHILNLLIAICVVLMYPRGGAATKQPQTKRPAVEPAAPAITPAAHPSTRLVVITLIAIGIIGYAHLSRTGLTNWKTQATAFRNIYKRCMAAIDSIKADTDKLVRNWELAEKHAILIREDDAIRTYGKAGEPTWDLVVFSDFECPSCKKTAKFLEEEAQRLFAGHLRFIFRHYPLNSDCNARTHTKVHKYACTGVAMVEAARLLGGGQAFWEAHDFLFANQDLLKKGQLTPEAVAIQLGFDPPMFESMMKSKVTAKRVWQDVNAAKTCGVMATPTVFVEGKKVDNLALREIAFWDRLADRYWAMAKTPRPDSAKLRPVEPTPGSRDRTDDP